ETCLQEDPDHPDALWCLAAARSVLNDREGLAALAPRMTRPGAADPRFHFLGAVCNLAAKNFQQALQLGQAAAADDKLAVEGHYLVAAAPLPGRTAGPARGAGERVGGGEKSPSAPFAGAMRGPLSFSRGAYDAAIKWWNAVGARKRAGWQLDEPLRQTT